MLKITWALDPFENKKVVENMAQAVSKLAPLTTSIEPVYVLSPAEISLHMSESQDWLAQYEPAARKAIQSMTSKLKLKGLKAPVILQDFKQSLSGAVKSLTTFAHQHHSELIIVSTHARTGLARFFLGSFTETLITHAHTSVYVTNPKSRPTPIKRILFGTDLSEQSKRSFPKLLSWAKALNAEVIVYHCIPSPMEPVIQSGVYLLGGGWVPLQSFFKTKTTECETALKHLVKQAENHGVKSSFLIETKKPSVVEAILKASVKQKADCIALARESGPIEATILGSHARQIVRSSSKPVLLLCH